MIGMSGGVDSSVAAYLLQSQGYDCIGVTMKLYSGEKAGSCCSLEDVEDAKSVCRRLGIPHYTFNFTEDFDRDVIAPFAAAYEAGQTPNPCIACNRHLKFGALWHRAQELGCDFVATGHYAQICRDPQGGYALRKATDLDKDQSYVLYFLDQEMLGHTLFPLGSLTKPQVREIARQQGFVSAQKPDSQDICFVPDGDYGAFLETYTGKHYAPGDFLDAQGKVLGRHRGAVRYTLGQRKGLGIPAATRLYVTAKDMAQNTVTLGSNQDLFTTALRAGDLCLTREGCIQEGMALQAKVRYRQTQQLCHVYYDGPEVLRVEFDTPQRAVTPGQALVLYQGDTVLGGGTIL
jgi:tRNA-specific 2-thiouridylase